MKQKLPPSPSTKPVLFLITLLLIGLIAMGRQWTVSAQTDPAAFHKLHTLYTRKSGVEQPAALAYSTRFDYFYLLERSQSAATLVVVTPYEHVVDRVILDLPLPEVVDLVFDDHRRQLLLFDQKTSTLIQIQADENGHIDSRIQQRLDVAALGLQQVRGIDVDAEDEYLYLLDGAARRVVRVRLADQGLLDLAQVTVMDLTALGAASLQGLAISLLDNHLFVLDGQQRQLYELNENGQLLAQHDLTGLGLIAPQDLVFAPGVYRPAAPTAIHLFIADQAVQAVEQADTASPTAPDAIKLYLAFAAAPGRAFQGDTQEDIDPLTAGRVQPSGRIVEVGFGAAPHAQISAASVSQASAAPVIATGPVLGSDTSTIRNPAQYGKPNQSRLWYNRAAGRWDALMPKNDGGGASASDHYILQDAVGTQTFTSIELEDRYFARPDVFWDDANRQLYVLASHPIQSQFWRLGYDTGTDRYHPAVGAPGDGVPVPGLTHANTLAGGDQPATLHVSPSGRIWAATMHAGALQVQFSADGGVSWLLAPVVLDRAVKPGVTTWTHFSAAGGTYVGLLAGENGESGAATRYYFWYINQNAEPTLLTNWVNDSANIPAAIGAEQADDHVSAARDANENLYFVVKTSGGNLTDPRIKLYKRAPGGVWAQFKVTETQETPEQSRPALVIDKTNHVINIYTNGAESVGSSIRAGGRKQASLNDLSSLASAPLLPLFHAAGTVFSDLITPRDAVDATSEIVVLAHNRTDQNVWFSHEEIQNTPPTPTPTPPPRTETVRVFVDKDAGLKEQTPSENFGAAEEMGVQEKSGAATRALYRFHLATVPATATIQTATLRFWVAQSNPFPVNIHRMTKAWAEFGTNWGNTANNFEPVAADTFTPASVDQFVSADVTALVRQWVNGSLPNYGIILIGANNLHVSTYRARENTLAQRRPFMEITLSVESQNNPTAVQPCRSGGFYLDQFENVSADNHDGNLNWPDGWRESGDDNAVGSGRIKLVAGELRLADAPDSGQQPAISRQVDLSGATAATLSFDHHTSATVDSNDAVAVQLSDNGGASWTTVQTFTGLHTGSKQYDISQFRSPTAAIRFVVTNDYGVGDEYFAVDNVKISCR